MIFELELGLGSSRDGSTPLDRGSAAADDGAGTRVVVWSDHSIRPVELGRRYLAPSEVPVLEAKAGKGQVPWLLGRVAAKQAVCRHLVSRSFAEIDPVRVLVGNDARGCPTVMVRGAALATRHLRISIAHQPEVAVALAATVRLPPPEPEPRVDPTPVAPTGPVGIGIDVEAIRPRSPGFERIGLTVAERDLVAGTGTERDVWLTRLWAAKEAVAKASGRGLNGRPKDFEVDAVEGPRLRCRGRWVATELVRGPDPAHPTSRTGFVVAWTDSC